MPMIDADTHVSGKVRQPVVVEVLAAESSAHRQIVGFDEGAADRQAIN